MSRTSQNFAESGSDLNATAGPGRVDLASPPPPLTIFQTTTTRQDNSRFAGEATGGQLARTCLSDVYFSAMNIDALQQGMRYSVWKQTNGRYTIGRQSDDELKVIMRSIYFQYARHQDNDVVGQVRELNGKVLDWSVKEVLANLRQADRFRQDVSTLPTPMAFGENTSVKGSRQLELTKSGS